MAHEIPFHQATFRPNNQAIPGNETAEQPVEFDLSAAGGPDLARLRSIVYASAGLSLSGDWSPEVQASVIEAFRTGRDVFVNTVDAIRHLTIPSRLAKKAGLLLVLPATGPDTPFAVTTGQQFAAISGWHPILAFHIAMELVSLSEGASLDPRFFGQRSTSPRDPAAPSGSATRARSRGRRRGTAGS